MLMLFCFNQLIYNNNMEEKRINFIVELENKQLEEKYGDYIHDIINDFGILKFIEFSKLLPKEIIQINVEYEMMNDYIKDILIKGGIENFARFIGSLNSNYDFSVRAKTEEEEKKEVVKNSINNDTATSFFTPTLPKLPITDQDIDKCVDELVKIYEEKGEGECIPKSRIIQYMSSIEVVKKLCERNYIINKSQLRVEFRCVFEITKNNCWIPELIRYFKTIDLRGCSHSWEYKFMMMLEKELGLIQDVDFKVNSYYCKKNSCFDFYFPKLKLVVEINGDTHFHPRSDDQYSIDRFNNKRENDIFKNNYCKEHGITILYLTCDKKLIDTYGYPYPTYTSYGDVINEIREMMRSQAQQ